MIIIFSYQNTFGNLMVCLQGNFNGLLAKVEIADDKLFFFTSLIFSHGPHNPRCCGVRGHEVEHQPSNHKVLSFIPGSRC